MKKGFTFNEASLKFLRKFTFKKFGGWVKTETSQEKIKIVVL